VWFVDLVSADDERSVDVAIAHACGIALSPGDVRSQLATVLADRRALVILTTLSTCSVRWRRRSIGCGPHGGAALRDEPGAARVGDERHVRVARSPWGPTARVRRLSCSGIGPNGSGSTWIQPTAMSWVASVGSSTVYRWRSSWQRPSCASSVLACSPIGSTAVSISSGHAPVCELVVTPA
jgi:hypothetical protein